MDSYPDVQEHESCAKRIKLDVAESNIGELCKGIGFSCFSTSSTGPIDITEGISADCDSGYEASTLESMPTPLHHTSPRTDPGDIQESMSSISESFTQTPTHTDQHDVSQDSLEIEDDDNASTVSELSGLSELSGQDWKPMAGSMIWIQQQMQKGVNPREILAELGVDGQIPDYVDDLTVWKLIINMLSEPPRRNKLRHINTLDDVVRLLRGAQNIIVLTGAGVSVSCGIPDFRSRDGIYSRLAIDFPNLPDPQAMFDISYFSQDPRPFFKFARDIYPGKFQPSPCHRFIKLLEKHKKLLRNYTQNIDTLEKEAEIERVIECHGSFATATCTKCGHKVRADQIRDHVLAQKIPLCQECHPNVESYVSTDDVRTNQEGMDYRELVQSGIMKPDIVFFGEGLPDTFHEAMTEDKSQCDLLLVIGSSLKVRPVALIPSSLPSHVPQILINREPLNHCHFDVELLGDCDAIINHLCRLLGSNWEEGVYSSQVLKLTNTLLPLEDPPPLEVQHKSSTLDFTRPIESEYSRCICTSTNSSSLSTEANAESHCTCFHYKSINHDSELETKIVKERHMSIDSAKDSGIGDNSNFTDKYDESDENGEEKSSSFCLEICNEPSTSSENFRKNTSDLRGYWQPKVKKSLADRLPENSFHLIPPCRYIFPGAEVYYDPDEKLHYEGHSSNSEESENGSECGSQLDSL
ncbi:NAD-dependent protein deacetylase sirtuin-1 isoform X1 [Diorhabda sublineata]|uniref:NAD-dependent protein deacetylase sirtuin-1 isoform X1 n=2 Tax=Diorhabda sublineata TaxID=1163346 RepID=UPI0024E16AB7|nr:NAD-dependent protein deacetylase sirtuin-1 isoform X1 [Diorhabda sublineata]